MKTKVIWTKTILCMALLCGWFTSAQAVDHVKGDGKLTAKQITVADFNAIKVDGVMDFYYEQSDAPAKVEVTVDQNLHPYVNIEVNDRTLTVNFKGAKVDHFTKFIVRANSKWLAEAKLSGNANLVVNGPLTGDETTIKANANCLVQLKGLVTVGKLDLNIAGSANMVVNNLKADKIECDIDGSGSVTLKDGSVKEGEYSAVGSGDIHAFGLSVSQLTCKMTGSGLMEVNAPDKLKANLIGKGKIRYKGPTTIEERIIGKGSIEEVK